MKTLIIVLMSMILTAQCFSEDKTSKKYPKLVDNKSSENANAFMLQMLKMVSKDKPNENFVISSTSMRAAMVMAWAGADGKTAKEIEKALLIKRSDKFIKTYGNYLRSNQINGETKFSMANSIWLRSPAKQKWINECKTSLMGEVFNMDTSNTEKQRKIINDWIAKKTDNLIKDFLTKGQLDNIEYELISVVSFTGKWKYPFNSAYTEDDDFHISENKTIKTKFMWSNEAMLGFISLENHSQSLKLPYKNGNASLIILCPYIDVANHRIIPINEYIGNLTLKELDKQNKIFTKITKFKKLADKKINFLKNMDDDTKNIIKKYDIIIVGVSLPKFELGTDLELIKYYKDIGISDAFNENANFSKMSDAPIYISKATHKAKIIVEESGTKAAAVSDEGDSIWGGPQSIEIDRPFVFFVRNDKTGAILFAGQVVNPNKK